MRLTRWGSAANACRRESGMKATWARDRAPAASCPKIAETCRRWARPRRATLTSVGALKLSPPTPIAWALAVLRPMPPAESTPPGRVWARPSMKARPLVAPAIVTVARCPLGPMIVALSSSNCAACLTLGRRSIRASRCSSNPSGPRVWTCRSAGPATVWTTLAAELVRLLAATVTANTSATATATPRPASSSCTPWTRNRRP